MELALWIEVEESLKKGTISITDQCADSLELSYCYLPEYLKPCFLYFAAFEEDQQVPAQKLLWLWIAEGFVVEKTRRESVEDVAEGYMRELINRNLVMIAETSFGGKVKSCVLHDLLHNFCKVKATEDCFFHRVGVRDQPGNTIDPSMLYRLIVGAEGYPRSRLIYPRIHTLMLDMDFRFKRCYDEDHWSNTLYKILQSKLLRVLILSVKRLYIIFPCAIQHLVHLKFLALETNDLSTVMIPPSFANLSNLETFICKGAVVIVLPNTLGSMTKLRILYSDGGGAGWMFPSDYLSDIPHSCSLQYLSTVAFLSLQTMQEVLKNFVNIRELKCELDLDKERHVDLENVRLGFLSQLQSLSIAGDSLDRAFQFPRSLRKLSLSKLMISWSKISTLYGLPNLEVLKLRRGAFIGDEWEMPEEEETFPTIRFLQLYKLYLRNWTASNDNFPCLEKLVLSRCHRLVKLPTCLAESSTLEMIEVHDCNAAADSIKKIQIMKEELGNQDLKIHIE